MKVLLLSLYFSFLATGESYRREKEARLIRINGDLILGGIFPMHEQVATLTGQSPCGAVKEEKGVQRLEAMLHALDLINEDTEILPNTTLGALIIDSCSSDTHALDQSMEFMRSYMNKDMSDVKCEGNKSMIFTPIATNPVSGVIGASSSVVSIMIANILRLFKIPQVSYASTSTELSDKSRFEYFSRVVPPDNFQAQAMVEVISMMGWKYVSTVAVEGDYGEKGIATFTTLATTYQICVATYQKIMRNSRTDFDAIIQHLLSKNARAVVLFVDEDNVRKLLQATIRANRTGYFLWVGSDSWGAKVHPVRDQEYTAEGAITILPYRNVLEDFNEYFVNLRPKMGNECGGQTQNNVPHPSIAGKIVNCRNIWFREFWAQHHRCTFDTIQHVTLSNVTRCTGMEELIDYEQEGLVPFVEDAVYTMAHAIHNVIDEVCVNAMNTSHHLCEILLPAPNGSFLLQHIRNLSFIGRQNTEIKFNTDGDAYGFYNIYQYQKNEDGHYDYILIGEWKEELILDINKTQWATGVGEQHIPNSICSENCLMGHVRNYIGGPCCWTCLPCRDEEYVVNDTCKSCDLGLAPDETKIGCVKIAPEVLPWISPWVLVPLICASIGIVFTIFTLCVFLRFNNTPAIRASGRELCYVLLAGILSCYSMSFVILSKPTTLNCTCLRIGLGLCLNMCYSAILTKTNRISRIFNKGGSNIKNVPYTSPTSQVLITIGIISVQLVGSMAWLIFEPPDVTEIYPYPMSAVLKCSVSTFSLMMSLLFNIILILLCTFYAFKTRKIPADYNEAKYIGFTMYSTCIVWLAFVPIYFGTNNEHKVQLTSLSMCVNISASVVLGCLFGPKVYLCLFQPQKNVRRPHVLPNTGLYSSDTRGAYSMRFAGGRSETMQSVTSISRSSPSMSRAGGRTNERKHGNGETQAVASPSIEETSVN